MIFEILSNNIVSIYYLMVALMTVHSYMDFMKVVNASSWKELPKHWQHKSDELEEETFERVRMTIDSANPAYVYTMLLLVSALMGAFWFITFFYNLALRWKHFRWKRSK